MSRLLLPPLFALIKRLMSKQPCEICAFRNPRATATALIVKGKKVLLAKRSEEPFKGWWDLIGGYMSEKETPEETLKREIKEELSVDCAKMDLLGFFPGYAEWKGQENPILSIAYLVELASEDFKINNELSELRWFSVEDLPEVAFDSNIKIINYAKARRLI
ncbi:MAG: NUDIX domain-containing protein [bacterium]|nr:NUDIX domain-containing protein [bacterium]